MNTIVNSTMGYIGDRPEYEGKRLAQMIMFGKNFENDNHYGTNHIHVYHLQKVV